MNTNPYSTQPTVDNPTFATPNPGSISEAFSTTRPLYETAFWFRLIGWLSIVVGVIYCLTIIGLLVGWLPIWLGLLLKNAGDRIAHGHEQQEPRFIYEACKNLRIFFTIIGILTLINLAIVVLYLVAVIFVAILAVLAGS